MVKKMKKVLLMVMCLMMICGVALAAPTEAGHGYVIRTFQTDKTSSETDDNDLYETDIGVRQRLLLFGTTLLYIILLHIYSAELALNKRYIEF